MLIAVCPTLEVRRNRRRLLTFSATVLLPTLAEPGPSAHIFTYTDSSSFCGVGSSCVCSVWPGGEQLITQIAETTTTVLITGESGTGKELVARAIHRRSPRRDQPFVAVNVAAIPDTLIESELFGHERGAFTGAHARKLGKFELAHGGTVFLDEIGSLRLDLQTRLLRVLQEREVERIGGVRPIPVDVRVLAATNINLRVAVRQRAFRDDLFYRLNVVPIDVPPLRQRRDDIPILVEHFVRKIARECNRDVRSVSAGALETLVRYDWPGNVRELQNVIHRAVVLARDRPVDDVLELAHVARPVVADERLEGPGRDRANVAIALAG